MAGFRRLEKVLILGLVRLLAIVKGSWETNIGYDSTCFYTHLVRVIIVSSSGHDERCHYQNHG